jgi:hypothetical protein
VTGDGGTLVDEGTLVGTGVCDPDTGVCTPGDGSGGSIETGGIVDASGGGQTAVGLPVGGVTSSVLPTNRNSGTPIALVMLLVLLTVGLVVAPAWAWRYLSQLRSKP